MKRIHVLLSALALVAAFSCSKEVSEEVVDNPNYNKETNEVVTNFVFNVSTTSSQTKQSSGAVQATSSDAFRGIGNAYLLTYQLANDDKTVATDADATKIFDLATVAAKNTLSSTNSRRVLEMSLPIRTNALLFYGKAPKGDATSEYSNVKDVYGNMDPYIIDRTSGSADIRIGSRLTDAEYTKFTTVENMFAGIQTLLLNHIVPAGTSILATAHPSDVTTLYGFDVTVPAGGIKWTDYVSDSGKSPYETTHERYPLEDKLKYLYDRITTIRVASRNEVRDGSGAATLFMAKELLSVLNDIRRSEPTSAAEALAKYFANEVFTRMTTKYFKATSSSDGLTITGVSFQENTTIASNFLAEQAMDYKPATSPAGFYWPTQSQMEAVSSYDPKEFPLEFNIPLGGSYIAFDETSHCFYYPQTFNVSAMGMPVAEYNAKNYFYPAELMYFGNSPIRVTASDMKVSDYPNGSGDATGKWENDNSWTTGGWSVGSVAVSTHAVAMKYDIQYGSALLSTQVQFAAGVTSMKDNNHAVQKDWNPSLTDAEEPDNDITVDANSFLVTGIIIGGQPKSIDWDYLPKMGTTYGFIYDRAIPAAAQTIGSATPNYTLVLDNFLASSQDANGIYVPDTQSKVYVAIEFKNNTGKDFYGNASLIRKDGYFYLVGCLDPSGDNGGTITLPSDHPVPPYNLDGSSQEVKRVFIQDFMTKAVFKLGVNSLKSAYLTVPDLRSSTMSLGLSVDLNWEDGLNFDDVPLG